MDTEKLDMSAPASNERLDALAEINKLLAMKEKEADIALQHTGNDSPQTSTNLSPSTTFNSTEDVPSKRDLSDQDTNCGLCGIALNWFSWCRTPRWVLFW